MNLDLHTFLAGVTTGQAVLFIAAVFLVLHLLGFVVDILRTALGHSNKGGEVVPGDADWATLVGEVSGELHREFAGDLLDSVGELVKLAEFARDRDDQHAARVEARLAAITTYLVESAPSLR